MQGTRILRVVRRVADDNSSSVWCGCSRLIEESYGSGSRYTNGRVVESSVEGVYLPTFLMSSSFPSGSRRIAYSDRKGITTIYLF